MKHKSLHLKQTTFTVLFALLLSAVGATHAQAQSFTEGNLNYTVNNDGVSVTVTGHADGTAAVGALDIPESVTHLDTTYSVTAIKYNAFSGCTGLLSVTIPASMTSIGYQAFRGCTGLLTLNYNATNCSGPGFNSNFSSSSSNNHWLYGCSSLVNLNIGESVQAIPDYFVGGGYYASDHYSFVGTLTIPNSVTTIGEYAFRYCGGFSAVSIGNSVTSIGYRAFESCTNLVSVVIPESVTSLGSLIFANCTKLASVVIPESVTSLESSIFEGCTSLASVSLPNSLMSIGSRVFYNCDNLASITIPNAVTTIGSYAFYGCDNLTSISIGSAVLSIGANAFSDCGNLTAIEIPNSVVSIGANAFSNCGNLTAIEIPNSVVSLGENAFKDCSNLASATIGNSMYSIGNYAFSNCTSLNAIEIPSSVASIGTGAFEGCTGLAQITVASGNPDLDSRDNCNAIIVTASDKLIIGCKNTVIPPTVKIIGLQAFYGCTGLTSVTLPSALTTIESSAFYGCTGITSITIPNAVTTIGSNAFSGCSGLLSATIGTAVTSIGIQAFRDCTGLLTLNYNATNCSGNGFTSSSSSSFENHWLYGCSSLTSLNIGENVQAIPNYFVNGLGFVGTLTIPNSVTTIGQNAFFNCYYLTSVSIGGAVVSIGNNAFRDCGNLASMIVHAETPPTVGSYAFNSVPTSIPIYVSCGSLNNYISANWCGFSNIIGMCDGEITASTYPVGGGTISGTGAYEGGDICTLTATSNGYLSFQYWTKNDEVVSFNPSYSFIVTGDVNYVANFRQVPENSVIGEGSTTTNSFLPSTSIDRYTLSQQIYTAGEIGGRGTINSIGFYNNGSARTRSYQIYLVHTPKTSFESRTDWITVAQSDCVFSGSVTMGAGKWTVINLNTPFEYDGISNVALVVDDNTGNYSSGMNCRVFKTDGYQAIYVTSDGTNYNPLSPSSYSGSLLTWKNQIKISLATPLDDHIVFADNAVKDICVGEWDLDGDDELNFVEAANATDLGDVFTQNDEITSFNELRYFTGLTAIGDDAFNECFALTSIDIPNTVTAIGDQAFSGCTGLTSIRSHAEVPPTLGTDVFDQVNAGINVYVPCGCAGAYNMVSWGGFSNVMELCDGDITATANPTAGGTVTGAGTYEGGSICTLTATPNTGYSFVNWTKNGTVVSDAATYSFLVASGADYVANFSLNSYDITATADPVAGGTIEGTGSYFHGSTATLTAIVNEGYSFVNWTKNDSVVTTNPTFSFTVTEGAAYEAHFNLNYYAITVAANNDEGGAVALEGSGSGFSVQTATIDLSAQGFTNGQSVEGITINLDENVTVVFDRGTNSSTPKYYSTGTSVRCYSSNNFVVTSTNGPLTSITLTYGANEGTNPITTDSGVFDGSTWTGEASSVTFTIGGSTGHRRIMVIEASYSGDGAANQGNFAHGSQVTLTATPNEHYLFVNWTKNAEVVATTTSYTFTVSEAADYVANFELESFDVTATLIPDAGGSIEGTGTYNYGSTATLTLTPNAGYNIVGWTKDGETVSTGDTYSFTVTGNAHLVIQLEYAPVQALTDGWNWYATYVELQGNNGLEQLENSLGSNGMIIKSRSNGFVEYYEIGGDSGWFGSLSAICNEQMYKIRNSASCNTVIVGSKANPADHPITIVSGWNWIGFPSSQAVNLDNALAGFTPNVGDIIKGRNGFANYYDSYGWYGSLNNLEPGQGYMYQSSATEPKTLTFQTGRGEEVIANITPENNVFQPMSNDFADNLTVTAVIDLDGAELRSDAYELAAFVNEKCRGSVQLMYVEPIDRYIAFLTVFGETDETLTFRLTNGSETNFSANRLTFVTDATVGSLTQPYTIDFRGTTGMDDGLTATVNVYPNPSDGRFRIEGQGIRKIEVFNGLGQTVLSEETCSESTLIDLSHQAPGFYMLHVVTDNGVMRDQLIKF